MQKAQRGFALRHPFFAMHVLAVCTDKSEDLGQQARGMLLNNAISRPSGGIYAGAGPLSSWLKPHRPPAVSLRDQLAARKHRPHVLLRFRPRHQGDHSSERSNLMSLEKDAGFVAEELLGEEPE